MAEIVADYALGSRAAQEGRMDRRTTAPGRACAVAVPGDPAGTAKLRILLVDPLARGQHGLGTQLVDRALEFARDADMERMQLWTNHPLAAARKIYLSRGFALVREEPHRSFGVDLIGQTYERSLDC